MKCHILFLLSVCTITLVICDNKNDDSKKKTEKRASKTGDKKLNDKRELDGQYNLVGGVGRGTAFSYTQVIQNHGKVRKVIHVPGSHDGSYNDDYSANDHDYHNVPSSSSSAEHDYGSYNNYGPTHEPYYGPIYVTAKPVLPVKETHGRSAATLRSNDNVNHVAQFSYPLFTPYHAGLERQYTVPVQVVYRIPYQRSFGYQVPKSYPVAVNNNPLAYPVTSSLPYAISKPYLNQLQSSLPYSLYFNNNYLDYPKTETAPEEHVTNNYSEEHKR